MATLPFFQLLVVSLLSALTASSPLHSKERRNQLNDFSHLDDAPPDNDSIFSVQGIAGLHYQKDNDGKVYSRREIRELQTYPEQWNLFLLGMQRFQNVSQDDKLSYFQIAGIHGRPWVAWDGAQGDPSTDSQQTGYCMHSSDLFPTWHRPYLALMEEILYLNCRQVVIEAPDGTWKDKHRTALTSLRLPYWDWAAIPYEDQGSMPWAIQRPTIPVNLPSGPKDIPNPLFTYKFHPIPQWKDEDDSRWDKWPQTMRMPTTDGADCQSQNPEVARNFDGNRRNMQSRVFNLLSMRKGWPEMSNKLNPGDSLEGIHGTVHDMVGADGNMLWLEYSAFDPVFWFHHANVDRLVAIWQEVNNDTWVGNSINHDASFAIGPNTSVNSSTPLKPFHKDDSGAFWTSDQVRQWQTFGYTYDIVNNLSPTDTITSRVNALYGPDAKSPFATPNHKVKKDITKRGAAVSGASAFQYRRQYTANIRLRESGFAGSIKFYFFFGEPASNDTATWIQDPGFVGVTSVLAAMVQRGSEVNTLVPLTTALEASMLNRDLPSMNEWFVRPYLEKRFNWRIVNAGGQVIAGDQFPDVQLTILWQEVEPAKSSMEFPSVIGGLNTLREATSDELRAGHFCWVTPDA